MVQAEGHPEETPVPPIADDVLAMDNIPDESSDEPQMPPLIDDLEVEMPAFPNLQNHQPMQVEEAPLKIWLILKIWRQTNLYLQLLHMPLKMCNWALCKLLFLAWTEAFTCKRLLLAQIPQVLMPIECGPNSLALWTNPCQQ